MGILYIVATPLGNLGDITLRALATLKSVDLVACEDTRQTIKLLNHYQIQKLLVSYFQHSKLSKIEYLAGQLAEGKNIALVTDAGTPGISDPGGKLIEQLNNWPIEQLKIVPIPGPCAAIAALSISGFPADKFVFMGFPPHKKGREKYFKEVAATQHTVVFYESTHRILKTLEQLSVSLRGVTAVAVTTRQSRADTAVHGIASLPAIARNDRRIVVCRELTKMFESIYRGPAEEILNKLKSDKNNQKGEFVVVVRK